MKITRFITILVAVLMLASCKIRIIVPEGGSVAEFTKFQADDIAISGKIIADKNISVQ